MSNTKHTPGPWNYLSCEGEWKILQSAKDCTTLALVRIKEYDGVELHAPDYLKANAKVIEGAPELLEALKEFVEHDDKDIRWDISTYNKWKEKAKAAIKKATE